MKTSDRGLALIKSSEGCRLASYRCQAGVLTVGYGHTGPDVFEGQIITQPEADMLLRLDVARFEAAVEKTCPKLSQLQFDACVSLCYNIGESAFASSSVARLHNAGEYAAAGQAFLLWNKVKGQVSRGLTARRAKESALYLEDQLDETYAPPSVATGEAPLSSSRTITGGTAALGTTGIAAAASQVDIVGTVTDHQDFIMGLLPYVHQYSWVLLAALGVFVSYMIYARVHDRMTGRA